MLDDDAPADHGHVPEMTTGALRILDTASELFYRHGIHAVGVDRIAAESGITKRTLYDRFGSKEALVAAYLSARHDAWWTRLEQRLAQADSPKVLTVFDAYAEDTSPSGRGCAFLNAAAELDDDAPAYQIVRAHKRAVRARMSQLVRADLPGVNAPEMTTDHLFLLLEGAIAHRGIDGDDRLLTAAKWIAKSIIEDSGSVPTGDRA